MSTKPDQPNSWLVPFLLVLGALAIIVVVFVTYGFGVAAAVAAAIALSGAAARVVHRMATRRA